MRAIMVMYDSLRRDMLPGYSENPLPMPNFERLRQHAVSFDNSYVCSMPCMPARRELHTGRANFLHRGWSPLEPFDDSMPELLKQNGVYTHLSTDHYHYIQDGGATYCGRYSSWECYRGQESDAWQADCAPPPAPFSPHILSPETLFPRLRQIRARTSWQNLANREAVTEERLFPQALTFQNGLDFLDRNASQDNWFLHIETFDPHEPFISPESFQSRWFDPDETFLPDWPPYGPVTEDEATVESMRKKYFALAQYCDDKLGLVLDKMDALKLWDSTMLIVNTDHGFFLGEHEWWGKGVMPDYNELVHTPLYIWDPRCPGTAGERRAALAQTIDLAPTLLEYFGQALPADMLGRPLRQVIESDSPVREYAVFGYHGGPLNITDGRYVYMRGVADPDAPFYDYTLMPTHMNSRFTPEELCRAQLAPALSFTKGCPVLRVPAVNMRPDKVKGTLLFDLEAAPRQQSPIRDAAAEARLAAALKEILKENDAPDELYGRYHLT